MFEAEPEPVAGAAVVSVAGSQVVSSQGHGADLVSLTDLGSLRFGTRSSVVADRLW